MIKKCFIAIMALSIIFTIGIAVVGCEKKYEEVNVMDAYSAVIDKLIKGQNIDTSSAMGGEVVFKLCVKNTKNTDKAVDLHIKITGNLDLTEASKSEDNNFIIDIINHNDNDRKLISFFSDGEFLYIDSDKSHYKIENFRISDLINDEKIKELKCINTIASIMAGLFFDRAEVNGGAYVFHYNLGNVLNNIKNIMQQASGTNGLDNFAKELSFDDWNDLNTQLSPVAGRLEYHFTGDKLISSNWFNQANTHEFYIKASEFKVIKGKYAIDFAQLLAGKDWVTTKLLNLTAEGELFFKSAGTTHARYTWELRSNLDLFELMANGGDFNMDKDDMAHFVIRNNLSDNSPEFNQTRIKSVNGVIFELAYDPKQLGTQNVLMAVNLKALLPKSIGKELNLPIIALNMIPDYYGMYFDNDIIKEILGGNIGDNETDISYSIKHGLVNILKNGVDLNIGAMDTQSEAYKMLNIFAAVGEDKLDNIDLKINKLIFADMSNKEYKLSEHFLGVADQETSEPKDFGEALGFIPSKDSTPLILDGKAIFNLSDGTRIASGDKLTEQQLNKIIGGNVEYTYTGYDNETYTAVSPVKIISVSGLDITKFDQIQTIKLITSPPDGKNLIGFLTAIDVLPAIPTNIYSVDIVLTK